MVRESISAATLGAYAEVFGKAWIPKGRASETALDGDDQLSTPRFAINALLMSTRDKDAMRAVFDAGRRTARHVARRGSFESEEACEEACDEAYDEARPTPLRRPG